MFLLYFVLVFYNIYFSFSLSSCSLVFCSFENKTFQSESILFLFCKKNARKVFMPTLRIEMIYKFSARWLNSALIVDIKIKVKWRKIEILFLCHSKGEGSNTVASVYPCVESLWQFYTYLFYVYPESNRLYIVRMMLFKYTIAFSLFHLLIFFVVVRVWCMCAKILFLIVFVAVFDLMGFARAILERRFIASVCCIVCNDVI